MIDLKGISGLPVKLDEKNIKLIFEGNLPEVKPATRTIDEMREVLLDKKVNSPQELYFMYRDVKFPGDIAEIKKHNLRYDITAIRPALLGTEYMKTAGHYHPGLYPELYEVLNGEAWCLLQKHDPEDYKKIADVILVKAKKGEKIVCLPEYGHILINPTPDEVLVTANWVSSLFSSDYSLYKKANGAAYFFEKDNSGTKISRNKFYTRVSEIKHCLPNPKIEIFSLEKNKPIYPMLKQPQFLRFLNFPEGFDYSSCFNFKK